LKSLDREGAPQAVVAWELFGIPKDLKCVERREVGSGAGVHATRAEFTFRTYCRLHRSYAETVIEEVIEANRRGTWTIDAAGSTGRCNTIRRFDSTMLAREKHLFD